MKVTEVKRTTYSHRRGADTKPKGILKSEGWHDIIKYPTVPKYNSSLLSPIGR
jgi:hypothetical protein